MIAPDAGRYRSVNKPNKSVVTPMAKKFVRLLRTISTTGVTNNVKNGRTKMPTRLMSVPTHRYQKIRGSPVTVCLRPLNLGSDMICLYLFTTGRSQSQGSLHLAERGESMIKRCLRDAYSRQHRRAVGLPSTRQC